MGKRHMIIHQVAEDLFLVQLDQAIRGFTGFVGSWLYRGSGVSFLVDVGPAATIPMLIQAIKELSVRRLECVLLTHVHIDHAGGIGHFAEAFPGVPVICHQAGIPHLTDPTRLWEGSRKTLGDMALAYGPIRAVPEHLLLNAVGFAEHGIRTVATPGHAPHHVSYAFGPLLFAGEVGGVYTDLGEGSFFLRPATPPRFVFETSIESLDRLINLPHEWLCYGHFGATRNTPGILNIHRKQLELWLETTARTKREAPEPEILTKTFERLLSIDPLLETWGELPPDVQHRERAFMINSIRGFVQYLGQPSSNETG